MPFVLFSATSGQVADKYDKATLMRLVKTFEIAVMLVGGAGFLLHNAALLYRLHVPDGRPLDRVRAGQVRVSAATPGIVELVGGNGLVEMGTFVAILIGTIIGGAAAGLTGTAPMLLAAACLAFALIGRAVSSFVPKSAAPAPDLRINWNPFSETWRNLALARRIAPYS